MKIFTKKSKRGFTLTELLVVIGIIGILSLVVLSSVGTARKKGRVAKRISDMKQVQAALEFYYAANHSYPNTGGASSWRGVCPTFNGSGAYTTANGLVIPGLAPTFIPAIPTDPQGPGTTDDNCYIYTSNGTDYAFVDYKATEMRTDTGQSAPNYSSYPELIDSKRDNGPSDSVVDGTSIYAWKVNSAGASAW